MRDAESDLQMCEAATPGPWRVATNRHPETTGEKWGWIQGPREHYCWTDKKARSRADAEFIAKAREALPYWIRRTQEMEKALRYYLIGAKHMSCAFEPDDPDPTWHCCDWSEVVRQINEVLGVSSDA